MEDGQQTGEPGAGQSDEGRLKCEGQGIEERHAAHATVLLIWAVQGKCSTWGCGTVRGKEHGTEPGDEGRLQRKSQGVEEGYVMHARGGTAHLGSTWEEGHLRQQVVIIGCSKTRDGTLQTWQCGLAGQDGAVHDVSEALHAASPKVAIAARSVMASHPAQMHPPNCIPCQRATAYAQARQYRSWGPKLDSETASIVQGASSEGLPNCAGRYKSYSMAVGRAVQCHGIQGQGWTARLS